MIDLELLQYQNQLRFQERDGKRFIYDPIRRKWLIVTPEELVRQLLVHHLIEQTPYQKSRIAIEKALTINGRLKRFDLLVYRADLSPLLLIECKAPKVPISDATFEQAAWYNFALRADYLLVTNGITSYCCQMDYANQSYTFLNQLPMN